MKEQEVSEEVLFDAVAKYRETNDRRRLGQYLISELVTGEHRDIFYEEDNCKAVVKFYKKFVA